MKEGNESYVVKIKDWTILVVNCIDQGLNIFSSELYYDWLSESRIADYKINNSQLSDMWWHQK